MAECFGSKIACQLPHRPIVGYEGGRYYPISGFGGRLLLIAPCVVRYDSRVALQFSPIMNKRHTNLWDRRSKSARTPLLNL